MRNTPSGSSHGPQMTPEILLPRTFSVTFCCATRPTATQRPSMSAGFGGATAPATPSRFPRTRFSTMLVGPAVPPSRRLCTVSSVPASVADT